MFSPDGTLISASAAPHCGGKKWKKKKIIPFRQNLLGSIRPFPEPIQFFVLGASLSCGKPPKRGRINQRRDSSKRIEPGKVRFCFFTTSQTRFPQGELISGSAVNGPEIIFMPIIVVFISGVGMNSHLYVLEGLNEGNDRERLISSGLDLK